MSTFRTITLVIASAALFGGAIANSFVQTGRGPVNVNGPSSVSAGSTRSYRVDVSNITSRQGIMPGDCLVNISCDNPDFVPASSTITIPAGSNSGWVNITIGSGATGDCEVLASNASSAASMVSTVD